MNMRFALAVAILLIAASSELAAQPAGPDPNAARARELFERGVELMQNQDWGAALVQLQASFDLRPTQVGLFNIGLCLKGLHRYGEAIAAFERLVREFSTRGEERVALARTEIENLRRLMGTVRITVNLEGAEVLVDGAVVGTSPLPGPIDLAGGDHVVGARLAGHEPAEQRIALVSGTTAEVALTLRENPPQQAISTGGSAATPISRTPEPHPTVPRESGLRPLWFYSGLALTGAAVITTAVLGILVVTGDVEYHDSDPRTYADQDAGKRMALFTDIALGVSVLAAVGTIIVFTQTEFGADDPGEAPDSTTGALRLDLSGGPAHLLAGVSGAF